VSSHHIVIVRMPATVTDSVITHSHLPSSSLSIRKKKGVQNFETFKPMRGMVLCFNVIFTIVDVLCTIFCQRICNVSV